MQVPQLPPQLHAGASATHRRISYMQVPQLPSQLHAGASAAWYHLGVQVDTQDAALYAAQVGQ